MVMFLNIALLVVGATATLSAFGGKTWLEGRGGLIKRITSRGWVSLCCLLIALGIGVFKEVASHERSKLAAEATEAERDRLLAKIEELQRRSDLVITSEERQIVDTLLPRSRLIERFGEPHKEFVVSGFTCGYEDQTYARWSDISGSSIQIIFDHDLLSIGYVFHVSPSTRSQEVISDKPLPFNQDSGAREYVFHFDARTAGYAEWYYGAAPANYRDMWTGWSIPNSEFSEMLEIVEFLANGGEGIPETMEENRFWEVQGVFIPDNAKSGVFMELSRSFDQTPPCSDAVDPFEHSYYLGETPKRFDLVLAARGALVSQSYRVFEEWLHGQL